LAAFLTLWLSCFVILASDKDNIRPEVIVMASKKTLGTRIGLAAPALTNLYWV